MLINERCTVCNDDVAAGDTVVCDAWENVLHGRCAEYETRFGCPECADDPEIGAVEF